MRHVPETASARNPRPLILFLHGLGGSGAEGLLLRDLAQRQQLFVFGPDGSVDHAGRRFWNAHPACCNFDAQEIDHVAYLDRLLAQAVRDYPVDPRRIFVIGFSNGGFMAHRLACEWGDRLAGIVSIAGSDPDPKVTCQASAHLRVLEIHGDADETVKFEGGTLFGRPNASYGSAQAVLENWSKRLRCQGRAVRGAAIDLVSSLAGAETDTVSYLGCPGGNTSLWIVHGGSHRIGGELSVFERAWLYLSPPTPQGILEKNTNQHGK